MTSKTPIKAIPPGVTPEMLDADFWLNRLDSADTPLLTPQQIEAANHKIRIQFGYPDLFEIPDMLSQADARAWIEQYGLPTQILYGGDGQALNSDYYHRLMDNALRALPKHITVRYGLMTHWDVARAFPTWDVATSEPFNFGLDRFQETTVDVGWPVAVITISGDDEWCFCLTPLYWGWIPRRYVALAQKQVVLQFVQADSFVMTTASQGIIAYECGGGIFTQMGTHLPLLEETDTFYRVAMPMKSTKGQLELVDGFISTQDEQFEKGNLPLTPQALISQAFKMLGEPYAWGGARMGITGRDCSRFIKDIYAVAGLVLPRNSGQQGTMGERQIVFEPQMADGERKALLVEYARPGAILRLPGHVMLYLGDVQGEPYVIHDMWGQLRRVVVSDLSLGSETPSGSLLRCLTHIVNVESCFGD